MRSQQITESCGNQPTNERIEKRRRIIWDENITRMFGERLVLKGQYACRISRISEKKIE